MVWNRIMLDWLCDQNRKIDKMATIDAMEKKAAKVIRRFRAAVNMAKNENERFLTELKSSGLPEHHINRIAAEVITELQKLMSK